MSYEVKLHEEPRKDLATKLNKKNIVLFNPKAGDIFRYTSVLREELLEEYDMVDYVYLPKYIIGHVEFKYSGRTFYVSETCSHFLSGKFIFYCAKICIPGLKHEKLTDEYLAELYNENDKELQHALELSMQEFWHKVPSHLFEYVPNLSLEEEMIIQTKIRDFQEYRKECRKECREEYRDYENDSDDWIPNEEDMWSDTDT